MFFGAKKLLHMWWLFGIIIKKATAKRLAKILDYLKNNRYLSSGAVIFVFAKICPQDRS